MNTRYVLPASLAATVHAFVLFGLPGKPPAPPTVAAVEAIPPEPVPPIVEWTPPESADVNYGESGPAKSGSAVPVFGPDLSVLHPLTDPIFITPSPHPVSTGPMTTIPPGWAETGLDHGPGASEVLDPRFLDHPPRARVQAAPDYPYEARSHGLDGRVVVEFLVDESGNVYAPVVRSATAPVFVEAALRAVARWKFEPGTHDGRRVRFRMLVPIEFHVGTD